MRFEKEDLKSAATVCQQLLKAPYFPLRVSFKKEKRKTLKKEAKKAS